MKLVLSEASETAQQAAQKGGRILMKGFGKINEDQIRIKGRGDYVTDLDNRPRLARQGRYSQLRVTALSILSYAGGFQKLIE